MRNLEVGDEVRISAIPVAVIGERGKFPETYGIFERALGRRFCIRAFNEMGMAELWLNDDATEGKDEGCRHTIWIEAGCLERD